MEHDVSVHGEVACVLPLLAVSQPHKESTPVRPCLDDRFLNKAIKSLPGNDVPVCAEKLPEWRTASHEDVKMLDIRKA